MLSAVVLTHNDEATIERTLASLTWCEEIVVLDDDSMDKTIERVKKNKARVIKRRVDGDFAAQRNAALKEANGDWVLFVDSDEVVSSALRAEIQKAITDGSVDGYYLKRQDILFGKRLAHGETGSVRLLRLAKKDAGVWRRPVHEVWDVTGQTGEISEPLLHYPHPNVAQFLSDINIYSTLNAQYLKKQHVRVPGWHIVVYPTAKFFSNYVLRLGFLDGVPGIIMAIMMSFHSFLTRAKLYLLWDTPA